MNGQAESAPVEETIDSLADFLETSNADTVEQANAVTDNADSETQTDEATEEAEEAEAEDDADKDEPEAEATPEKEFTVKIKGDDGEDKEIKVTQDELIKGYHRQADYTRKTQQLAERENEAVRVLQSKHQEVRDTYLRNAEVARTAIAQMAGFKSDAEMAELANSDPATYVAESHRQQQIKAFLMNLDQQMNTERQQAMQVAQQAQLEANRKVIEKSWQELEKLKIDKPKLVNIYKQTHEAYGFTDVEMAGITDHRLVKMMADAVAYRNLKTQAPKVTQQAKDAPRIPSKQNVPTNRISQAANERFRSGRAKLADLVNYL